MPAAELGHGVVREAREVARERRLAQGFDRRRAEGEDLDVLREALHDAEALVEVVDAGDRGDALLHVGRGSGRDLHDPIEVRTWKDVRKDVQLHGAPLA